MATTYFTQVTMLRIRYTEDTVIEAGVDEAGRGPLWGPLYAGAVIWTHDMSEEQAELASKIKDSKKLSEKRRNELAENIKNLALDWSTGIVTAAEIDTLGMTKANQLAFTRALDGLSVTPERLIIDGCLSITTHPWSFVEQNVEPEADGKYVAVAAASIIAKVEHDDWIKEFCELNENIAERYDLLSCKGYGTKKHRDGILEFGPHEFHRKLFLRKLLGTPIEDKS
jgi:ribonuclease HII